MVVYGWGGFAYATIPTKHEGNKALKLHFSVYNQQHLLIYIYISTTKTNMKIKRRRKTQNKSNGQIILNLRKNWNLKRGATAEGRRPPPPLFNFLASGPILE